MPQIQATIAFDGPHYRGQPGVWYEVSAAEATIIQTAVSTAGGTTTIVADGTVTATQISEAGLGGALGWGCTAVGATPTLIPAAPLAGRAAWVIKNVGAVTGYLGGATVSADQTATGGYPLSAGESLALPIGAGTLLYGIGNGGVIARLEAAA
jgi:hypothetical protein